MKWHPLALKFDALTGEEWAGLVASIKLTKGCHTQPVLYRVVKGQREGLDGRQRFAACKELRLPCRLKRVRVKDADVAEFVLGHNLRRRHLTPEARAALLGELRAAGMSTRKIAAATGISQPTVSRSLAGDSSESPATVTGADGKTYSATRQAPAGPRPTGQKLLTLIGEYGDHLEHLARVHGLETGHTEAGRLRGRLIQLEHETRQLIAVLAAVP